MSYEPRCVRNCEDAERYHLVTWSKHAVASMQHASPQAHPPHTATRRLGVTHISHHSLTRCLWSSLVSVVSQAVYSALSQARRVGVRRGTRGPRSQGPHTGHRTRTHTGTRQCTAPATAGTAGRCARGVTRLSVLAARARGSPAPGTQTHTILN